MDDDIEIDMDSLPFNKNNENEDFQIAITGKTFEILYRMNLKYEKIMKKNKEYVPKGIDTLEEILETSAINDDVAS